MFPLALIGIFVVGLIAVSSGSKPKYAIGDRVKVPLDKLTGLSPTAKESFNVAGVKGGIIEITGITENAVAGNLVSTYTDSGPIMLPSPLPLIVPTSAIVA